MSEILDFKKHKDNKKVEIIIDDLVIINRAMDLSIRALSFYSQYIPVMEAISSLKNNKTLIEIHLNKYTKQLKENESKLEESKE